MDLKKNGELLAELRKAKGMTQKQVAEKLEITPKTVSKWETGHGFPDVSVISTLADLFGVSERVLLNGNLNKNTNEAGNIKKTRFYVCSHCGSVMNGMGNCRVVCCGKMLEPLECNKADERHIMKASVVEDDFFIEFNHEMTKDHYISFVAYIGFDRMSLIKLYPEQDAAIRLPKVRGGKFYYFCTKHGLFEYNAMLLRNPK